MELHLDHLKQKGAIKRALFLHSRQPHLAQTIKVHNGALEECREMKIYLRVSGVSPAESRSPALG